MDWSSLSYHPHIVQSIVSATIGARSARSVRGPRLINCAPDRLASSISSGAQPPSGPTNNAADRGAGMLSGVAFACIASGSTQISDNADGRDAISASNDVTG